MKYIPKYQQSTGGLPTYKGKPTTADKIGSYLKRSSQYIAESLPQFGMNIPFDALRDLGVKVPVTVISPTGYQGSYGTNQTTKQFAKHLVNNAGEAAAIDMGFGVLGKGVQVAAPYVKQGVKNTGNYLLKKSEPYLLGDKKIPMMNVYKPKQEFWNPFKTTKEPVNQKSAKLETPKVEKPKPRYIINDTREYTNEEIEFIKNRDAEFKTNYLDVLNAKNKGKSKYTIIPSLDNTGKAYHGRHIDLDFGIGDVKEVSRMQVGHQPNLEYIQHPSKYNTNISQITIETDPRKFRHEDSHANDLASDLLQRHNAASIVDEKHLGEINAGNFNNYGLYSKLKSKILLTPVSAENKFTKSLMSNKKNFDEYLAERIKEAYGDRQLLPKDSYFDIEPIKKEVLENYNYLTEGSEIKARLTDIKEDMVTKGIIKNETSPVTMEHIMNYTPSDEHYKEIINLYKNKSDILKDLSKVGVLSTVPAGLYGLTQSKKQGGRLIYKGQKGLTIRPTFDEWYKTVPKQKNDTTFYNLRKAYELAPQEQLDSFVNNPSAHLYSAYQNPKTKIWEFMKSKHHPTLQFELDWFNSNDPEAIEFRKSYDLDTTGAYYKYIPKHINKLIPKGQNGLKWNQRLYNAIDPTLPEIDASTVAGAGIATALGLNLRNKNKYPVEEAAWKKRLNLPYDKKYLPNNPDGSVRLPDNVASQIVVDTNFVKNRIANQRNQQKYYAETRGYESKALNDMLKVDQAHLDSLRKFYNTGKSVGLNEFGAWKDRDVIDPETGTYKENVVSPLNVLHNFTLYRNPKTKKPMYGDIYDFNWADVLVPGKPYEISGPVK